MRLLRAVMVLTTAAVATSCGGGGSATAPQGMTYAFVTPKVGDKRLYSEVIVDNSNNTIDRSLSDTVTAVNADGTYVLLEEDPNHQTLVVNGFNYTLPTETVDVDATGHVTTYSFVNASNATVSCSYTPHGSGPAFPLSVGMTWSLDYTLACSTGVSLSYTQTGSVIDVESVTVPAGTFTALKLQSTVTWTDGHGTTHTQSVTNWRDVASSVSVREVVDTAYSGTLPTTGYPVSNTIVLQSRD